MEVFIGTIGALAPRQSLFYIIESYKIHKRFFERKIKPCLIFWCHSAIGASHTCYSFFILDCYTSTRVHNYFLLHAD